MYREHKNKDKRLVAAVLDGVRKTIQDWYSSINNNVSPVIPMLIREDKSVIMEDLSPFLYNNKCRLAANGSVKFLKNLRSDIIAGRLKKMNLDVETITKVIDEIGSFEGKVFEKYKWVKEKKDPKEQARVLQIWLSDLLERQTRIDSAIWSLQDAIGYDPQSIRKFFEENKTNI